MWISTHKVQFFLRFFSLGHVNVIQITRHAIWTWAQVSFVNLGSVGWCPQQSGKHAQGSRLDSSCEPYFWTFFCHRKFLASVLAPMLIAFFINLGEIFMVANSFGLESSPGMPGYLDTSQEGLSLLISTLGWQTGIPLLYGGNTASTHICNCMV